MFISDAVKSLNLSEDDVRMTLVGVRDDWDSCQEISEEEYQLISQSVSATALPPSDESTDNTEIQPVADMPIEKQQTLIDNVSQILGHQMVLSVQRRIEMVDAIDKLTNQVILSNRETNQKHLAAQIAQQDDATKAELMQAINTLQGLVNTPVEMPQRSEMSDFNNAIREASRSIASVQKKMQR
ncbi:MAG: hypothetical protein AAF757_04500 [Cyanobacteria bacterium P01_D01_bin.116]